MSPKVTLVYQYEAREGGGQDRHTGYLIDQEHAMTAPVNIKIDETIFIESDEHQYIVRKFRETRKPTEKKRTTMSYFPTIEACKKHILMLKIADSKAETLAELLREVELIAKEIESKIATANAKKPSPRNRPKLREKAIRRNTQRGRRICDYFIIPAPICQLI